MRQLGVAWADVLGHGEANVALGGGDIGKAHIFGAGGTVNVTLPNNADVMRAQCIALQGNLYTALRITAPTYIEGVAASLVLPPGGSAVLFPYGGQNGGWFVVSASTGGGRLQQIPGYPVNIANAASYDLTFGAAIYDRMLLSLTSSTSVSIVAVRDGSGTWSNVGGASLGSGVVTALVNGGNLTVSSIITGVGGAYGATHAGGLSGVRLAPTLDATFSANNVTLSGA